MRGEEAGERQKKGPALALLKGTAHCINARGAGAEKKKASWREKKRRAGALLKCVTGGRGEKKQTGGRGIKRGAGGRGLPLFKYMAGGRARKNKGGGRAGEKQGERAVTMQGGRARKRGGRVGKTRGGRQRACITARPAVGRAREKRSLMLSSCSGARRA